MDENERERLFSLSEQFHTESKKDADFHVIFRTNCIGVSDSVIMNEFTAFRQLIEEIERNGHSRTCFSLLYESISPYLTYIRDTKDGSLERIITDDIDIYDEIKAYSEKYHTEDLGILEYYSDESYSLNLLLGIEHKLNKALSKKVWLNSGGSLMIEPTEALTAIDVNTDKAVRGNRKPETTYLKINLEAAKEIARQLRVRNLSGIIIVDFIVMKQKEHKEQLMNVLREELKKDKVKTALVGMTALGLVEITRMKVRRPLHEMVFL
jgi:ribonuclease G